MNYKIFNEDCIHGMDNLPQCSVDLIVTSPPYNLGIKYDVYNDNVELEEYYKWCELWLCRCYNLLKMDGRICINHYLSCGTAKLRTAPLMRINNICEAIGFHHHGLAIWDDRTLSKRTAWGSWLSSSAPYINSPHEGILIMYKDRWKRDNKGKTDIGKDEFMEACSGIWKIAPEKKRSVCPAPFPVALPARCIKMFSYEGDTVCDPFMGGGTTGVACAQHNRDFVGFELSQTYCDHAARRIDEEIYGVKK
jgi:site-specific DNA-methyltransferase (adenine-specific)